MLLCGAFLFYSYCIVREKQYSFSNVAELRLFLTYKVSIKGFTLIFAYCDYNNTNQY